MVKGIKETLLSYQVHHTVSKPKVKRAVFQCNNTWKHPNTKCRQGKMNSSQSISRKGNPKRYKLLQQPLQISSHDGNPNQVSLRTCRLAPPQSLLTTMSLVSRVTRGTLNKHLPFAELPSKDASPKTARERGSLLRRQS